MKRLLYLTVLSMLVVAMTASVALAQSRGPSGADGSFNCPDFDTQPQAQAYFEANNPQQDPDGLDRDNDGLACEDSLPEGETGGGETGNGSDAVSCDQFISAVGNPSQFQAQQFYDFEATPAQQAALDADGDGFACDDLETGVDNLGETDADRAATNDEPVSNDVTSTQYVDDGEVASNEAVAALPDTGGPALLLPIAGLALLSGGLLLKRRLS